MEGLELLFSRHSVRQFTGDPINDGDLRTMLLAGMSSPSCTNACDWSFIVVRDREMMKKMAEANGKYAAPLLNGADIGILICGDLQRAFPMAPDYWVTDCAIALENIHLAAHALGLGSCILGVYPQMQRVENQRALFQLPDHIVPHSILAIGHPAKSEIAAKDTAARWDDSRIHYERW